MRLALVMVWCWMWALAAPAAAQGVDVDLELILAVDISQSVDPFEAFMQRQGYVRALSDPQVIEAIQSGFHGRIAVTYFEWGGPGIWITITGWRVIANEEDAIAMSQTLATEMLTRGRGTSISGALGYAMTLFNANGFHGERRVIDISGDGPNSSGGNVSFARDDVVAAGVTVNGLAINNFEGGLFPCPTWTYITSNAWSVAPVRSWSRRTGLTPSPKRFCASSFWKSPTPPHQSLSRRVSPRCAWFRPPRDRFWRHRNMPRPMTLASACACSTIQPSGTRGRRHRRHNRKNG